MISPPTVIVTVALTPTGALMVNTQVGLATIWSYTAGTAIVIEDVQVRTVASVEPAMVNRNPAVRKSEYIATVDLIARTPLSSRGTSNTPPTTPTQPVAFAPRRT